MDHIIVRSYELIYLLTKLNLSWEATNSADTQELASILWDPKFHYRVHKSPPLVPILNQIDSNYTCAKSSSYEAPHYSPNILLSTLFSNTLSLCSSLNIRDHVLHPYSSTCKIIILYISRQQTRRRKVLDWMVASITRIQSPLNFPGYTKKLWNISR
jgi:hypothetical protein